jgi:hypothetical protein
MAESFEWTPTGGRGNTDWLRYNATKEEKQRIRRAVNFIEERAINTYLTLGKIRRNPASKSINLEVWNRYCLIHYWDVDEEDEIDVDPFTSDLYPYSDRIFEYRIAYFSVNPNPEDLGSFIDDELEIEYPRIMLPETFDAKGQRIDTPEPSIMPTPNDPIKEAQKVISEAKAQNTGNPLLWLWGEARVIVPANYKRVVQQSNSKAKNPNYEQITIKTPILWVHNHYTVESRNSDV